MSLQRKFALLLGVLGLVVALNLAAASWSVYVLERELSGYLSSVHATLGGLTRLKRHLADAAGLIPGSQPPLIPADGAEPPRHTTDVRLRHQAIAERVRSELAQMEAVETHLVRIGSSTWRTLRDGVHRTLDLVQTTLGSDDPALHARARERLHRLHELIEAVEIKVHGDAGQIVAHGRRVRNAVAIVLGVSLAAVLAAGVLGTALVRRWVVQPVESLREAADRFARGEFTHRVRIPGHDELALLGAEVNDMAAMIAAMHEERVERERLAAVGEMVRRIAHNLRNPLAGIRSLAELTRGDVPPHSPAREHQDRIVQTVDRFETWLADLLKSATPQAIHPEPVAVADWLRGTVETHRAAAAAKGVQLVADLADAPRNATFDPRHLEQAVVVLLTNAIQASPPQETVQVAVTRCENGKDWEIRVTDRGPGVPDEILDKIFRPYFTTKAGGTGIGLAFAKQVVEQHGGRIRVDPGRPEAAAGPQGGPGASFVIRLPLDGPGGGETSPVALATIGQGGGETGAIVGQNPDHRGRGEPAVLDSPGAAPGRA